MVNVFHCTIVAAEQTGSRRMSRRILLLGSYAPSLVNFRGPLIGDLTAAGHSVFAAAPDITDEVRDALKRLGATPVETPLERTGLNFFKDLAYRNQVAKLIREHSIDLVFTYTIKPNVWGSFAAAIRRIDSVAMITGLGFAFTSSSGAGRLIPSLRKGVVSGLARLLYRRATCHNRNIVFQNPDDRRDFIEAGCLADVNKSLMTAGSGVDTAYFSQQPLPTEPVFLMITRLLGNKGVREYARAALLLKNKLPHARFLLAGYFDEGPDGIDRSELENWVDEGLEYLGPLEDVRPALGQCSVYVLPSYREGTPRSVLEAMSVGRAIITSDAPGCRETVVEGENGLLAPIQDYETLAEKMAVLAANPTLRDSMGRRSRSIAVEKYDCKKVNRKLIRELGLER